MFNKENSVYVKNKNINWKEAVKIGVDILVKNKIATPQLSDAIFKATSKNGAYWVLEKGIALAHAPVGDYNLKPGISLVLLENNIQFNKEDKWARIIITLSAVDETSHMKFIQEFGFIFMNAKIKKMLINAKSLDNFLEIYNLKGGSNGN